MKPLRLILIAVIIGYAAICSATADNNKGKPKPVRLISLSLEQAMTISGLSAAMFEQIDRDHFLDGNHYTYTAEINYNGAHYRIKGTLPEWIRFFKMSSRFELINPFLQVADH